MLHKASHSILFRLQAARDQSLFVNVENFLQLQQQPVYVHFLWSLSQLGF